MARIEAIARQQGIILTAEQITKVKDLSRATVEYRDAIEDARERQEALRSIGGDVLKGIASDARNGASALDILTSAVGRLADRLSDKALDSLADSLFGKSGSSGGGGILGSLLGGSGGAGEAVKGLNLASLFGASPLPTFATGVTAAGVTPAGIIEGPGTGTSDSIVAKISRGESIVTAKATAANVPLIKALNEGASPEVLDRIIRERIEPARRSDVDTLAFLPRPSIADGFAARVSRGESFVDERATKRHPGIVAALNAGRLPGYATGRVPALSIPPVSLPGFAAGPRACSPFRTVACCGSLKG